MKKFLFITDDPNIKDVVQDGCKSAGMAEFVHIETGVSGKTSLCKLLRKHKPACIIAFGAIAESARQVAACPVLELSINAKDLMDIFSQAYTFRSTSQLSICFFVDSLFYDLVTRIGRALNVDVKIISPDVEKTPGELIASAGDGIDVFVASGNLAVEINSLGLRCLPFIPSSDNAAQLFLTAATILDAMDVSGNQDNFEALESRGVSMFATLSDGTIINANQAAETNFNCQDAWKNRPIYEIIPQLSLTEVSSAMDGNGRLLYKQVSMSSGLIAAVELVPFTSAEGDRRAIVFCMVQDIVQNDGSIANTIDRFSGDYFYRITYKQLSACLVENAWFIPIAKRFATFDYFIHVCGSHSYERQKVANYLHDASKYRNGPFIRISANDYLPEEQAANIFGNMTNPGLLDFARGGDLFIDDAENLTIQSQNLLQRVIDRRDIFVRGNGPEIFDVRVIIGSRSDLLEETRSGRFLPLLFYYLHSKMLRVPTLDNCPREIIKWMQFFVTHDSRIYNRPLHITRNAINLIGKCPWKGGLAELAGFCRMAVHSAPGGTLDEAFVRKYFEEMTGSHTILDNLLKDDVQERSEKERLMSLIKKYNGARNQIAREMGISTTTLWRKMKKYNLV